MQFVEKVESSIIWGDLVRYDGGMQEIMFFSLARLLGRLVCLVWRTDMGWPPSLSSCKTVIKVYLLGEVFPATCRQPWAPTVGAHIALW